MNQASSSTPRFHAGIAGSGPPVLFIPGSNADLRRSKTALKGPLIEKFEVLTYDQRGTGQTKVPDGDWCMMDYARDAIAVLDGQNWDKVHVVGYSFGGMVAQEVAINWPERVERLVLAATTAGGAGGRSYPIHKLAGLAPHDLARRRLEIADLEFSPEWQAAHPGEAKERIAQKMRSQSLFADEPGQQESKARLLAVRASHDTYDRLARISAKTLVLAGNRDGQAPVAAQQAMAERIPRARFEVIQGGHGMLWADNVAWISIKRFLEASDYK